MKSQLRKHFLEIRSNIADQKEQCKKINEILLNSQQYKSAESILLYINTPNEVFTQKILKHALKTKKVYIPFTKKIAVGKIESAEDLIPKKSGKKYLF